MAGFNTIFSELKDGLSTLIKDTVKNNSESALAAGKEYLELLRDDLKMWSEKVLEGELSSEDVQWLIASKKDLAEMILLKQKGLTLVAIDAFKNKLSQMLSGAVTKSIGI